MTKNELQYIFRGESETGGGSLIAAAASYLRRNASTGKMVGGEKYSKKEETENLIRFSKKEDLVLKNFDLNDFVSAGAEQKVFISDNKSVFKLNDGIYFENWLDYFYNLQLHKLFFPETKYNLIDFLDDGESFYAAVHQKFVLAEEPTDQKK